MVLWRSLGQCSRCQVSMKVYHLHKHYHQNIIDHNRQSASSVNRWRGVLVEVCEPFGARFSASFWPYDHKTISFSLHLGTSLYTLPVTTLFRCLVLDKKSQTMCSWKLERGGELLRLVGSASCWGLGGRRALPRRALHFKFDFFPVQRTDPQWMRLKNLASLKLQNWWINFPFWGHCPFGFGMFWPLIRLHLSLHAFHV